MRLLFYVNPKSGRGRAISLADAFEREVAGAGHAVNRVIIGQDAHATRHALDEHDAVVVFGGDGTLHSLLPSLTEASAAVYHVPMGTENLFARQFRMDRLPGTLRRALDAGRFTSIDVGDAGGRLFAIMCSAGPDAAVVRRLAARRTGAIRHASYIRPILSEVLHPSLGAFSVEVDGRRVVDSRRGLLVIGNSPMYALRLNPARNADMTDGLLDVVFLPASASLSLAKWAALCALGSPLKRRGVVFHRGRSMTIRAESPTPYQLDGDEGGIVGGDAGDLRISVRPGAVRVLAGRE